MRETEQQTGGRRVVRGVVREAAWPAKRTRRAIALAIIAVACVPGMSSAQTVISLRGSVRLAADSAVTIGDVALVQGDDAERVGKVVLSDQPDWKERVAASRRGAGDGWIELSLQEVRQTLEKHGVNLGRTTLRGSVCNMRVGDAVVTGPARQANLPGRSGARSEPEAIDFSGPATVRHAVASAVARHLSAEVDDVHLGFDAKDAALLGRFTAGQRVDVQPAAASTNEVLPLRIYIYQRERLVASETIAVRVLVRREQVTASQPIDRRTPIDESMVSSSSSWVPPSTPMGVTIDEALGALARARIAVGQVITRSLIEQPVLIKKGDKAEVHCLSGTVTLKAMRARALADGREGEYIAFQIDGSKKTFSARVNGRGLAVLAIGRDLASE
ncbi:MAG: flagellar basal body P-ring formation chaperone FlgA [Phycisphaerales bacterium]